MNCRVSVCISLSVLLLGVASAVADSFVLDSASPTMGGAPDVLNDPGPAIGLGLAALGLVPGDRVDALSFGDDPLDVAVLGPHDHLFSVSRATVGDTATGVEAERLADTAPPGGVNGHPADIFLQVHTFGGNVLAPASPGLGWSTLGGDEANAGLITTITTPPGDDVVAYELTTMSSVGTPPFEVYFSLAPGSPSLLTIPAAPGDIIAVGGAFGAAPYVFAPEASLLIIPPGTGADIDALSLEVAPGAPTPTLVRAQFSVTSATASGWTTSNGDVVDSGAIIVLYDAGAGVSLVAHTPAELGLFANDELDALEATFYTPPPPAPPSFDFDPLPELAGGASRALGFGGHDIGDAVVVGEAREAAGNWRAVIWQDSGNGYEVMRLPAIDAALDGKGDDVLIVADEVTVCVVVGASEASAGVPRPVLWRHQGVDPWIMTELPTLGGQEGEDLKVDIGSSGEEGIVSVGWATNASDIPKAVVWMSDGLGGWTITALPEIAGPAGRAGRANDVTINDNDRACVGGAGENQLGQLRPLYWEENAGGSFDPNTECPLLPGGSEGAVLGVVYPQGPMPLEKPTLVGWSDVAGGNAHAVQWEFHDGQWVIEDLGTLQGFANSQANSFDTWNTGLPQTIVGVSDDGAGQSVATIWMYSGGVAVATDLNELTSAPQSVVMREATAGIYDGTEKIPIMTIVGSFTAGASGRSPGGGEAPVGVGDPHAFLLTSVSPAIPTISQWGAAIMVMLLLASGTIVFSRHRRLAPRNTA